MFLKLAHLANQASLQDCPTNHQGCTNPSGRGFLSSLALPSSFSRDLLPLLFAIIPFYHQSSLYNPAYEELFPDVLFWYYSLLFLFSHMPISPLCSDTDWRRNCVLVRNNMLAAICLSGKAQRKIHRWIYLHLQCTPGNNLLFYFSILAYSVISGLIISPQWLQWCALSPKGQHILLIDLSHAPERVTQGQQF